MAVIRGTDFDSVRLGLMSNLPKRFIPCHISERKLLQANDIVFETAGGSKDRPTGRSVFLTPRSFENSQLPLTCASFSRFVRIDPNKADPGYIYWLLQYLYSSGYLRQFHTQHTGVARFQWTDFANTPLPIELPDLPAQRQIADTLSAYDDLIENNTRRIAILEEMAQRLYREWFVHFRYPGHESVPLIESELDLIPEGWTAERLESVTKFISRGISPKYDEGSSRLVLNQRCVREGRINDESARRHSSKVPSEKILRFGDLLINSTGVGTLGRVAQVRSNLTDVTVDSHVTIVRPSESVEVEFIGMQVVGLESMFAQMGTGSTGQTELSRSAVSAVWILIPPIALQRSYSLLVSPLQLLVEYLLLINRVAASTRDRLQRRLLAPPHLS